MRWLANDDNGDTMEFKVEIRGVNETGWKLLHDKIREHYYELGLDYRFLTENT